MVRKDLGVRSALELDGASVCVNIGTTTELNMADFFRANKLSYKPVVFEKTDEVVAALTTGSPEEALSSSALLELTPNSSDSTMQLSDHLTMSNHWSSP